MQCKKCVNVHKDPITGNMQCRDCGAVIQESQIVDDLEFDENQNVVGTFVGNNKFAFYARGNNALNQMVDSSQRNLTETYKLMDKYSNILIISDDVRDKAKNLYFTASNKKFTQGRKKELIVGALLFIPAGTIDYWNGWLFMGLLFIPMFLAGIILMIKNPELLRK